MSTRQVLREAFARPDALGIVLANLLVLALALAQGWGIGTLLWPYWMQSVGVGLFNFLRIQGLQRFDTAGVAVNDVPVPATQRAKRWLAWFFVLHYGLFHGVYLLFLCALAPLRQADAGSVATGAGLMLASLAWTHRRHRAEDAAMTPNLGTLLFLPYIRLLPIHLTLIFGMLLFHTRAALVLFGLLKTVGDVLLAYAEERFLRRPGRAAPLPKGG